MNGSGISRRRIKEIRSLTKKKYRERLGEMLVEGMRSVASAVAAGAPIREVLVTQAAREQAKAYLGDVEANVHVVEDAVLESISTVEESQGIVAVVAIERVDSDALASMQRVIALDGLQDPGNAGTLIRSAAWFGVEAVVTAPGTVDIYNPKVVRAAMGGLWDVAHAAVEDLALEITRLRESGFAIYAADLEGRAVGAWQPREPSVLILGSEAHGVSAATADLVDERVVIPGSSRRRGAESLNVAVAAGIVLYEWTKERIGS